MKEVSKADLERAWDQFKLLSQDGQRTVTSRLFGKVDAAWPRKAARAMAAELVEVVGSETAIEAALKEGGKA